MRFIGHILANIGYLLIIPAVWLLFSGNWAAALGCMNTALAFVTFGTVTVFPAWAFERAQQISKSAWLTIAVISSLLPPLGFIAFASWSKRGRIVKSASI